MTCKGDFQNFEQFHFGNLLIAVHIPGLDKQADLVISGISLLLASHCVVEVGCYLGVLHVPILVGVVLVKHDIDHLPDLFVASYHFN